MSSAYVQEEVREKTAALEGQQQALQEAGSKFWVAKQAAGSAEAATALQLRDAQASVQAVKAQLQEALTVKEASAAEALAARASLAAKEIELKILQAEAGRAKDWARAKAEVSGCAGTISQKLLMLG